MLIVYKYIKYKYKNVIEYLGINVIMKSKWTISSFYSQYVAVFIINDLSLQIFFKCLFMCFVINQKR